MMRYMVDSGRQLMTVHFEKGHAIVITPFSNSGDTWYGVYKMTLLASGYAVAAPIQLNMKLVSYTEKILRKVWYRLSEDGSGESSFATAEEIRPVEIHKEHHPEEGDYACDCGIDRQQAHVPAGTQIWRVHD